MQLYISDSESRISYRKGRVTVWSSEFGETHYPIETLDGVNMFGRPAMTTAFILEMLKRHLDIQLFSTNGHYMGRITAPQTTNASRIRAQVHCADDPGFCLEVSKALIANKIRQQEALTTAYTPARRQPPQYVSAMHHSLGWIHKAESLAELNGFEGNAAKAYFAALRLLVPDEFAFTGRSTRPPTDAFNSMLSLGYSLLYKNIIGAIERHSLNPYIGFLHQDSRGHATLASDLMEVWRAPVIDDTVLRLITEGLVRSDEFIKNPDTGGVYATRETTRSIARAIGNRIARTATYISGDPHQYTFQYALDRQLQSLARAIASRTPSLFVDIDISTPTQEQ